MRALVETQSREIERLRAVIADMAKERPRKLISVTQMRAEFNGQVMDYVFAIANDGTHWRCDRHGRDWTRLADLPQPDSVLKD
jgi:hypothetical protein